MKIKVDEIKKDEIKSWWNQKLMKSKVDGIKSW